MGNEGSSIGSNSDLNLYKTIGNYYCPQNSIAQTLINSPIKKAFTMKVEHPTGRTEYLCQSLREYDTGHLYFRYYSVSDGWHEWSNRY